MGGWWGVDLDGTLAEYRHGQMVQHGIGFIGKPVPAMLKRVMTWLDEGKEVRIMTARAAIPEEVESIKAWCRKHIGRELPVTDRKDFSMIELWDDRAVGVKMNEGYPTSAKPADWVKDEAYIYKPPLCAVDFDKNGNAFVTVVKEPLTPDEPKL